MLIFILQIPNSLSSDMMLRMAQLPKQDTNNQQYLLNLICYTAGLVYIYSVSGIYSLFYFSTPNTFIFQVLLFTHIAFTHMSKINLFIMPICSYDFSVSSNFLLAFIVALK